MTNKAAPAPEAASPPDGAVNAPGAPPLPEGWVNYRVTKFGKDKIATGEHVAGFGDLYFPVGAIVAAPKDTAEALEALHFAEIQ